MIIQPFNRRRFLYTAGLLTPALFIPRFGRAAPVTVDIAQSGGDYTSLTDFATNYPNKNLVTADEMLTAVFHGSTWALDDSSSFTGWTTDATRFIQLTVDPADRHTGQVDTGFALICNSNNIRPVTGVKVQLEGIRFKTAAAAALVPMLSLANGGSIPLIDGCFFDGANILTVKMVQCVAGMTFRNCFACRAAEDGFYIAANIVHCTAWGFTGTGRPFIGDTGGVIRNCISVGNAGNCILANGATVSYCIVDDTSATGTGVLQSRTATDNPAPGAGNWVVFEDITTAGAQDLRLQNVAENDALGAGVADFATDFEGDTRANPPDIGADEFDAGGGSPSIIPHVMHHRRQQAAF